MTSVMRGGDNFDTGDLGIESGSFTDPNAASEVYYDKFPNGLYIQYWAAVSNAGPVGTAVPLVTGYNTGTVVTASAAAGGTAAAQNVGLIVEYNSGAGYSTTASSSVTVQMSLIGRWK